MDVPDDIDGRLKPNHIAFLHQNLRKSLANLP